MEDFIKRRKKLSITILVIVLLIGVAVGPHYVRVIRAEIEIAAQAKILPGEIEKARESLELTNDRTNLEQQLVAGGVVNDKIGETEASVCFIRTRGQNWQIVGYTQLCYVRFTSGYYTDLTKTEVVDRLQQDLFNGNYTARITREDDCWLSAYYDPVAVSFVAAHSKPSYENEHGTLEFEACGRPSMFTGINSKGGHTWGTDVSRKVIKEVQDSEIDTAKNQIWLEEDKEYFSQPVVCRPSFMTPLQHCSEPRKFPVQ